MLLQMALVATALALPGCKNIQFENAKFDLSNMDQTWIVSKDTETPPTVTTLTWYYNPCGAIKESNCPPNSQLCGVETVVRDGKSEITQIIPIFADGNSGQRVVDGLDDDGQGLRLLYQGARWGDQDVSAEIVFTCDSTPKIVDGQDSWQDGALRLVFSTPSVCADRDETPNPSPSPPSSETPSRGLIGSIFHFIWVIFILFVVTAAILGALIFIRYRRTGQTPINREDFENLVRDLPYLVRDFFRKVRETFGGSSPGYSAV